MKASKGEAAWIYAQIIFLKVMYSSYLIYLLFLLGFALLGPLVIIILDIGEWKKMYQDLKGYLKHVCIAATRQGYLDNQYRMKGEIEDVKKYM